MNRAAREALCVAANAAAIAVFLIALPGRRAVAQCPSGAPPPCERPRTSPDTARYAILPFAHTEGSQPVSLDGADCAEFLTEAFERWVEVRLADRTRIYDALARRGARAPFHIAFDTGLTLARQLGAGRLVMGHLWNYADTLRLTADLYDVVHGGALLRQASTRVALNGGAIGSGFNALADSLLGAAAGVAEGTGADVTRSLRALRAYDFGQQATREWDLIRAAREFRAAIAADPDFAHAYVGLGQALLWAADSTPEAGRDRAVIARRAADLLSKLARPDRALLLAQQAMFERRWPDACRQYRDILATDSTHFAAWYGLAECNAADPVVIPDRADTTRFVFRGSWETAVRAYRRALLLAPSFNFAFGSRAAQRLTQILPAQVYWWREGRRGTVVFFGFPEIEADTLAFHPVPAARAAALDPQVPGHAAAVDRNRGSLVEITEAWVSAFPREARAHRALAYALELTGRVAPITGAAQSALTEIVVAKRLERRSQGRVADAISVVRLFVKAGDFDAARRTADSLLREPPPDVAGAAGVAVLLGRPALASRLVAPEDPETQYPGSSDNTPVHLPENALQVGLELLAYASAGAPRDSIAALEQRVDGLVALLPITMRSPARSALLDVPAQLAFDAMGLRAAHRLTPPGPPLPMARQWALAHGDTASVRAALVMELAQHRGVLARADSPPDGVYLAARLLLAIGDTAAAERTLDAPLNELSSLHGALFRYVPLAGALVRMMALRARVAERRQDTRTAQRWAAAVIALWSGAEPALQDVVTEMRQIALTR
jgi:tetratricopeptide (TPR) repeat protein